MLRNMMRSNSYIQFVEYAKTKIQINHKRYKWVKGGSTSTAQGHLWRDHKIDKDHPEEEPDGDIRTAMKHIIGVFHQLCKSKLM